jgi:hypothetical protein
LGTVYGVTSTSSFSNGLGYNAISALTSGQLNNAVGYNALSSVTTGSQNIAIGHNAGYSGTPLTTGSGNTYIGGNTQPSGAAVTNEIVLGITSAGGSNTAGKGSSTAFITANGGSTYNGANSAAWAVTSDRRLKKNIVDNNVGLDAINAIQVRNFEYRLPEEVDSELTADDAIIKPGIQLGVIAQELQAVLPDCVKQESTGVLRVDSDNLTWYMVNAIKQLSVALDAANARISALEAK